MVVASFLLLWALDLSLSSAESFASLGDLLSSPLAKFVVWGIVTALIYHSFAGVRHLIMDFGVGETMEGGILGARLVFVLTAVSAVLVGVALW
jgi:succinate dehydrogenase / fumarate reductase cytochrome b subunit